MLFYQYQFYKCIIHFKISIVAVRPIQVFAPTFPSTDLTGNARILLSNYNLLRIDQRSELLEINLELEN